MKKIALCLVAVVVCGAFMTGCKTTYNNDMAADSKHAMVPALYQLKIEHKDVKVEGSAAINVLFGIFTWGADSFSERAYLGKPSSFSFLPDSVQLVKEAAVYNACSSNNCDLLIGSKYEVVSTDYFVYKKVTCSVKGYPGNEIGVEKKADSSPIVNLGCAK